MAGSEILVRVTRTSGTSVGAAEVKCSSRTAPWRDLLRVERRRKPPLGEAELTPLWPTVSVIRGGAGVVEQRAEGEPLQALSLSSGSILVYPEGAAVHVRATDEFDSTCVQISPALLAGVERELGQPAKLAAVWRTDDEQIERMATLLETELRAGCPGGRAYGEYLARALAAYLVRRYSGARLGASAFRPARPERIAGALQYIEAHIAEEMSLSRLAQTVHLSPYHFARLFKQSTGLTPHQYILHRRIEEAKRLVRHTSLDLAEIAQRLGFRDQSHFTARFRKATGMTPRRWRERP